MAGRKPDDAFLNRLLYFHYPHYRNSMPHSAIITESRKVIHFYERPDIPMLFDLSADPGEVNNIAKSHPQEHQQLYDEMMDYFKKVGARIPKPNPDHDPDVYRQDNGYEKRVAWGPFEGRRPLEEDEK
jgi:hypothetical protein